MARNATDTLRKLQSRTFRTRQEEIAIGVLARRDRMRRIWISALGLGLLTGALLLYSFMQPPPATASPTTALTRVRCVKCEEVRDLRLALDQVLPLECAKCREHSCHELWACRDCRTEFLPNPLTEVQSCPRCASTRVGTAAPLPPAP